MRSRKATAGLNDRDLDLLIGIADKFLEISERDMAGKTGHSSFEKAREAMKPLRIFVNRIKSEQIAKTPMLRVSM